MSEQYSGKRRVATVGTFDGLHRGHRFLLEALSEVARERGLQQMVVCFDRHPLETIAPHKAPGLIQHPGRRHDILSQQGFHVLTLDFTPEMAALTARQWLRHMHREHGVDVLLLGYDNTFGSDGRRLSPEDYFEIGKEEGVQVLRVDCLPGAASTRIRALVGDGQVEEAAEILGHPFSITGHVSHGDCIGRSIGFPTANITPPYKALLPKEGVYAVAVTLPDGSRHPGLANIGRRPTISDNLPLSLEVNIVDFSGDLYDKELTVEFICRLREEIKFPALEALKNQIKIDKQHLMAIWK